MNPTRWYAGVLALLVLLSFGVGVWHSPQGASPPAGFAVPPYPDQGTAPALAPGITRGPWLTITPNGPSDGGNFGPNNSPSGTAGINEAYAAAAAIQGNLIIVGGTYTLQSPIVPVVGSTRVVTSTYFHMPAMIGAGTVVLQMNNATAPYIWDTGTTAYSGVYLAWLENLTFNGNFGGHNVGSVRLYTTSGNFHYLEKLQSNGASAGTADINVNATNPNQVSLRNLQLQQLSCIANGLVELDMVFCNEQGNNVSLLQADVLNAWGYLSTGTTIEPEGLGGFTGGSIYNFEGCWFSEAGSGATQPQQRLGLGNSIAALRLERCWIQLNSYQTYLLNIDSTSHILGTLSLYENLIQVAASASTQLFGSNFQSSYAQLGRFRHWNNQLIIGSGGSCTTQPFCSQVGAVTSTGGYLGPAGFGVTTPSVPTSGSGYTTTFPFTVRIFFLTTSVATFTITDPGGNTGPSITAVAGGMIDLDPGATITPTYTTLTWKFYGNDS